MDFAEIKNLGFMTREEAAETLGVSTRQLHRYVTSGRIDFCLYRGRILFHESRLKVTEGAAVQSSYYSDRMEELGNFRFRISLIQARDKLYQVLEANLDDDPLEIVDKISDIESKLKAEMLQDRFRIRDFCGLSPELTPEQQQQELAAKRTQTLYISVGAEGPTEEQQQQIKQAEEDKQPHVVNYQRSYNPKGAARMKEEQEQRERERREGYRVQHYRAE